MCVCAFRNFFFGACVQGVCVCVAIEAGCDVGIGEGGTLRFYDVGFGVVGDSGAYTEMRVRKRIIKKN